MPLTTADTLRRCARDMELAADAYEQDARSIRFAEQRVSEVERICTTARAAVRGRG